MLNSNHKNKRSTKAKSSDQCIRRSPRLSPPTSSSSSTPTTIQTAKYSMRSDTLALSLHAFSYPNNVVFPISLNTYQSINSSSPNHNCLRRSPRSTNNRYSNTFELCKTLPISRLPSVRTTISIGSDAAWKQCNLIQCSQTQHPSVTTKKGEVTSTVGVGIKRSRSWMVPLGSALCDSADESLTEKVNALSDSKMKEKKCVRRSQRLVSSINGDVNGGLLTLPEPPPCANTTINVDKIGKAKVGNTWEGNHTNKNNNSNNDSNNHNNSNSKTASESKEFDLFSGKCVRSRNIMFHVDGGESVQLRSNGASNKNKSTISVNNKMPASVDNEKRKSISCFIGERVPDAEARQRWRWRYELKSLQHQRSKRQSWILNADEEDEIILNVDCHYAQAKIDGCIFNIGDCAFIKGEGRQKYVGRILEFFKTMDGEDYFRVQWFFRAEDTIMKEEATLHDKKRLFISALMNDNLLDCIISKVNILEIEPVLGLKSSSVPQSEYYYDMEYCVEYSTFRNVLTDDSFGKSDSFSSKFVDTLYKSEVIANPLDDFPSCEPQNPLALLDLYSGCGGMSTGLCIGARHSGVNLLTRWAVDFDRSACDSLKLNHPETHVRNEAAEDFLNLLKEWEKLCHLYVFNDLGKSTDKNLDTKEAEINVNAQFDIDIPAGEFEVSHLVDICFGDPNKIGKRGLNFKVRWKGYGPSEDTWEPIEGLSNCQELIRNFMRSGLESKILPLPGDVDVVCGGPPCQGISGYNRFRNLDAPLDDERNRQIIVFMDVVKFLRPKYVLMENVVDILRFDKASLARYALTRLVDMRYQARLGTIAAGCYGLPQFRLRVFLWGALPSQKLPQFPLPTHDVIVRYWPPPEFERNTVAYDEGQGCGLEQAVTLRDAISDLPAITSNEHRERMTYKIPPETEFQKYIRLTKNEIMGYASGKVTEAESSILYDHRPYQLSEDNYLRVCQIPHRKGANFRDFPGVVVGDDNVVYRDPLKKPVMLPSGKPMVPDFVFNFEQGKSKRPFARLWWDETVATVVTFPNLCNQAALHPEQDRVLTIREYARLQGFPDFYRFCGSVKERYCQVGNAVAVPVARALGYALGMALHNLSGDEPLMSLPPKFSFQPLPINEIIVLRS